MLGRFIFQLFLPSPVIKPFFAKFKSSPTSKLLNFPLPPSDPRENPASCLFPSRFCRVEDTSRDQLLTNPTGAKNICTGIHFSCNFARQRKMLEVDVDGSIRREGEKENTGGPEINLSDQDTGRGIKCYYLKFILQIL